jgi:hypothetical protein
VDCVIGVRRLPRARLADAPPLLDALESGRIACLGTLDGALLTVLDPGRLLPADGLQEPGARP